MNARDRVVSGGWGRWVCGAVAFVTAMFGGSTADALSYSAKSISAVVIDADTKQPLSDVNVLIEWDLQSADGGGGPFWIIQEAETDKQGRFRLAGWGPKLVPQVPGEPSWRLGPEQPTMYLFKSGYSIGIQYNPWESWMLGNQAWTGDLVRSSVWDNKTIELRRFSGSNSEYLDSLARAARNLPLQACRWSAVPRFTAALINVQVEREPREFGLPTLKTLEQKAKETTGCVSPRQMLGPYLK